MRLFLIVASLSLLIGCQPKPATTTTAQQAPEPLPPLSPSQVLPTPPASLANLPDLLFDGVWTSYQNASTKPFILVENVAGFAEHVLADFEIGERDFVINPKYAKLGWDRYWENDEWWTETGLSKTSSIQWRVPKYF